MSRSSVCSSDGALVIISLTLYATFAVERIQAEMNARRAKAKAAEPAAPAKKGRKST